MTNTAVKHGSGRMSSGPASAGAAFIAAAVTPAAAVARKTISPSRKPSRPSSPIPSTSFRTTTRSFSSSCASSNCSSCSCAMPRIENDAGGLSNHVIGNEIKDGGEDDDTGIGEGKSEGMQRQGPVGGGTGPTPMLQHPIPVPIVSQTTQPAVPATLNKIDKEAPSMVSTTGSPPSSDFLAPPLASIVSSAGSRSESNPQRHADAPSVPVPQVRPYPYISPLLSPCLFFQWLVSLDQKLHSHFSPLAFHIPSS